MKGFLFIGLISVLTFLSCGSDVISIENELINKSILAHGGMERWESLQSIDYTKDIVLFTNEGIVEKELNQTHQYSLSPNLSGTIEWSDSLTRKVIYKDGSAYKINGDQKEEPSQSALNSFNSAYYVLNMPWKLKDSSAVITYQGLDTMLDNRIVHNLKVEYPSEEQNDVWEYYLDEKEYYLVANKVFHGSTTSLITNDDYSIYKGLKFNSKRTSYMVDSLGEVLFVRAKYEYIFR